MSGVRYQPYARFPRRFAWIDSALAGFGLPYDPIVFGNPGTLYQHPSSSQSCISHGRMQRPIEVNSGFPFPRVRELGFRLAPYDLPAASMSMLSVVMEPSGGEGEGGYEGEEWEGEYEDEDVGEYRGHPGEEEGDYGGNYDAGGEEGYVRERGHGSGDGYLDEPGDNPNEQGEYGDGYTGEGDGNRMDSEEDEPIRGRQRKPRKLRRPYTVTCALRKTNWFESSMEWENEHFRVIYRVSKDTFWGIVRILRQNPIFQSQGRKPQRPVHYQLGVFLMRYGIVGSHVRHPKLLTSIGEGTVVLYCRRVIRAIREHGLECVVWPTEERKEEIKKGFKKMCGLDGVIGALDGTHCGLETKPRVNVQAIVDHNGVFIAFQSGWAGSRPDCFIWPHMWVYQERGHLFAPGEFLLADGGYTLSPFVLIPYSRNQLGEDRRRRREFNYKLSSARIVVEWAFGRLKARFPALKKLGAVHDMRDIYRAIEAMMVVHNMCHALGDVPDDSRAQVNQDDEGEGEGEGDVDVDTDDRDDEYQAVEEQNRDLLAAGKVFRQRCVDILCPR